MFIANITATYYSREQVWSTPYNVVFGEPFPDASLVVPFGCGALVLLDKDDRSKFQTRCALLIFIHYATSHPLYTYAFFSPRTKRVLYRQDAIFLVTTFPMRAARHNSGLTADGEPLVAVRSPLVPLLPDDSVSEFSFARWQSGDSLPDYEDHTTGVPFIDDPNFSRPATPALPLGWPHRYPHHPSFGPQSTVLVPVPPLFSSSSDTVIPLAPDALSVSGGDEDVSDFREVSPVVPDVTAPCAPVMSDVASSIDTLMEPDVRSDEDC